MKNVFLKTSEYVVNVLFGLIAVILFVLSLFVTGIMGFTDEHIFFVKDYAVLLLPGCFAFLLLLVLVKKKWKMAPLSLQKRKKIFLITACLWGLMMLLWILLTLMNPVADQLSVFEAAKHLLQGDYADWKMGGYMYTFPFQNGLVLLYALFHLLFGSQAVLAVELFNAVCWFGTIILLTKMIRKKAGDAVADITYILLLFFFPMWGYVTFVYGTVPGLFFATLAFEQEEQYEEKGEIRLLILSSLSMVFAVMWKSNYEIFLVALGIMMVLYLIREKDLKVLIGPGLLCAFLWLEKSGILLLMHMITGEDTGNGIPMLAWIAMGLRDSNIAPGFYNRFTLLTYEECGYNSLAVKKASWAEINRCLALFREVPEYGRNFFLRKICAIWESPMLEGLSVVHKKNLDGGLIYPVKDILYNGGIANTLLILLYDVLQTLAYLGYLLHLCFGKKELKNSGFVIAFIGGFIFHIFWEGKCQYAIPYFVVLLPLAVQGFGDFLKTEFCPAVKKKSIVWSGLLVILVGMILALPVSALAQIKNVGTDTGEYIYFATNQTEWKEDHFEINY